MKPINKTRIAFISMPWNDIETPSIQIGALAAEVDHCGWSAFPLHFNLKFADFLYRHCQDFDFTSTTYQEIGWRLWKVGLGEWVFKQYLYTDSQYQSSDGKYEEFLADNDISTYWVELAFLIRSLIPDFFEECIAEIDSLDVSVVGFSSMHSQNIPSLALAKTLSTRRPDLKIIFGGANCDGPMGKVIARKYSWLDAVVSGEAERSLVKLLERYGGVEDCKKSESIDISTLKVGSVDFIEDVSASPVLLTSAKTPIYDDYFERLKESPLLKDIEEHIWVPFESSRGCWWGEKSHCTFCGLNGASMTYRSKPAQLIIDTISDLSAKYKRLRFASVDNILDPRWFKSLLPSLKDSGLDVSLFYEIKANLSKEQIRLLRKSGVRRIQPGIESLSSDVLRLMKKGITAAQNVQTIKWAAENSIDVEWNVILGTPNEPLDEYDRLAALIPHLIHLIPPRISFLRLDRFSPYHSNPSDHGVTIEGPMDYYKYLYDDFSTDDLDKIAYFFRYSYKQNFPLKAKTEKFVRAVNEWQDRYLEEKPTLEYELGLSFMLIHDRRNNGCAYIKHELGPVESRIYESCDGATTMNAILRKLSIEGHESYSQQDVQEFLDSCIDEGLIFKDEQRYLALATRKKTKD